MRRDVTTWPAKGLTAAYSYFLFFSRFPNSCFYLALGPADQILSLGFQPVLPFSHFQSPGIGWSCKSLDRDVCV